MITVNTRLEDLYALGYLTKQCYTWSVDTRSWQTLGDVVRETASPNGLKRVTGATPLRVGSLLLCLGRMRFVPLTDKVARNFAYLEDGSVRLLRDLFEERSPLYERYADLIVEETGLNVEQTVERIEEQLKAAPLPISVRRTHSSKEASLAR